MPQIKASDVKRLRDMTGAGMMDCKKALVETAGDLDAAVDHLRKKGLSAAAKKAGRVAAEGIVLATASGTEGAMVEVNSETDFVSKNDKFIEFVQKVADITRTQAPVDVAALMRLDFDANQSVAEALSQLIATIGENIQLRRLARVQVDRGIAAAYVHGGGKIGVLVAIESDDGKDLQGLARDIAMHIAAANPRHISRDDVPEDEVKRERAVLTERAAASGKPENIIQRIVDGQLNKFYADICLLEQPFVKDSDHTVGQVLQQAQAGARVVSMHRFQLGEGIDKGESDFAAEVAAQLHG